MPQLQNRNLKPFAVAARAFPLKRRWRSPLDSRCMHACASEVHSIVCVSPTNGLKCKMQKATAREIGRSRYVSSPSLRIGSFSLFIPEDDLSATGRDTSDRSDTKMCRRELRGCSNAVSTRALSLRRACVGSTGDGLVGVAVQYSFQSEHAGVPRLWGMDESRISILTSTRQARDL